MFSDLIHRLKAAGVPVSLTEYLALMAAMERGLPGADIETFYFLARAALVKDERHFDRFDRVFGEVFRGLEGSPGEVAADIPEHWLAKLAERYLSEEEKAEIEALGGWDRLMELLRERLSEQRGRHQGGSKWIGTAGTSPFGAYGYNPEGVRIGQDEGRNRRAAKIWDRREYRELDDGREIGTRTIKMALRRLRRFAREGAADELDLDATIRATAERGHLDLQLRPERRNTVKVLLFLDIGGSMDDHIRASEELFSAARAEFKRLDHYYFHNCLYEMVWRDSRRRWDETTPTWELLHTHPSDTKVIFVGDAAMNPYELVIAGGAVEHFNAEAGEVWLRRVAATYPCLAWLNPVPQAHWDYTPSIGLIRQIVADRMFPLTLDGLDRAMRELSH